MPCNLHKILCLMTVLFVSIIYGQTTDFTTDFDSGSCGNTTVSFSGSASSTTTATSFTFNGGTLPSGWSASPFTVSSSTCPGKNSPDNSAYFWATNLATSGTNNGKRFVQTNAVDVSLGGNVSFYIRYGNNEGSGCEQPDLAAEEVYLQYSIDSGSNWINIFDGWDCTSAGNFPWYNWYWNDIAIPSAAQTANTLFRWYQPSNSGTNFDNWGLEDVSISATVAVTVSTWEWNFGDGETADIQNPDHTFASLSGSTDYTVSLTAYFSDGSSDTATKTYTVYVDDTPPTATCSSINETVNTGSGGCTIQLPDFTGLINATDDCSTSVTVTQNPAIGTVLSVGTHTINFTIADDNGNDTAVCPITVTVVDNSNPNVTVRNTTLPLDSSGTATLAIADIELTSSDNCGIDTKVLEKTTFDCSNLGANTINYTVTDIHGNTTVSPVTVTVVDTMDPTAKAQDLSLQLTDPAGLTITPAMVDNGSTDNCSFTLSLSKTTFNCDDIGTQTVTLTATDGTGNINTTTADITITSPDPFVVTSAGATQMGNISTFTTVDPTIAITYNGNADGALVSISNNFYSGDALALDPGYTIPGGVSVNYNSSTGVLTITGTLTDTDLETLFQNIQFRTTSGNTSERTIEFIIGGSVSNPDNNHYYEYVNQSLSWVQAKAAATTRTLYGLQGYLATSTSLEENNFIKTKLTDDGWLGGSDEFSQINQAVGTTVYANQAAAESNWYWITGPEAGTQFSIGNSPLPGNYANWNGSEPNNSGGSEDYLQVYFANDGRWNDLGMGQSMGYIVEYGGLAGDQACFSFSNNKIVLLNQAPVIDPIANVAGCPGSSFTQNVTISDVEDAATDLTITIASNNQTLVQDTNLSVSYDGTNFVVTGTPEAGIQNSAVITITATDTGGLSTNGSFTFTAQDTEAPIAVCLGSTPIYVGSFRVSDGPSWGTNPPVYNAQETAALIFGGNPSDYAISTNPSTTDANTITHTAWTDSWGDGFAINAEDYSLDAGAPGYNDPGDYDTAVSSWVNDHVDFTKVNYVWTAATPVVVLLDSNGQAVLDAADVDGGSTDNCGIASITVSPNNFSCADIGPNTVTLTVTDVNGNSSTCSSTVIVKDNIDPTAICQSITVQLDATGNVSITPADLDNGSNDACGIASTAIDIDTFDCSNIGTNDVVLTVTDNNGNVSTCTAVVTVEDNVAPTAICQSITVQLDDTGNVSITPADVDNGSNDACGIASTAIDIDTFDCSNIGTNEVVLTVTDNNGNVSTCTAEIIVEDNVAPTAVCKNITVQLDANGDVSIIPSDVDGGSNDACGIASTNIDISTFDCSNVGTNNVVLSVTDNNGNTSTCTAVVTVEDNVAPIAICQSITVQLDATGNVSITPADVDGGSNDACGIASTAIDIDTFDCSNVGSNNVVFTVTDFNGNASSCTAIVTVEDTLPPSITCPSDIIANTDLGECTATAYFAPAIALDNCGIDSIVQLSGLPSGSEFPVGVNTVEFSATDVNGNVSICSFSIIVTDNQLPVAVCQNITVQLDEFGNAAITAADVDGGSTDQCGVATTTIDVNTFDCSNIGDNNVILTVTDVNGNISSCTAIVTVEDVTAPVVVCQNITVELDPITGTATIAGTDIDNGSNDACGIASYVLDIDSFDCSNIGDNIVILTVTDVNGNTGTCSATVTVEDNTSPVLVCQDYIIEIGADGTATLDPSDVIASNNDACGILSVAVDVTEFSCADIGTPISVQVFSQDSNGNLATCMATVTAVDLLAPVVSCPTDQTVDPGIGNLYYIVPDYFSTGAASAIDNCTEPLLLTSQNPAAGTAIPDGIYTISLTATDEYGNIGTCEFDLTVDSVLGVGGNDQNLGTVTLYPIPTKNILNVGNPQNLDLERIEIYDLRGRLILAEDLHSMGAIKSINVDPLEAATYMVRIKGRSGEITKRLLKE